MIKKQKNNKNLPSDHLRMTKVMECKTEGCFNEEIVDINTESVLCWKCVAKACLKLDDSILRKNSTIENNDSSKIEKNDEILIKKRGRPLKQIAIHPVLVQTELKKRGRPPKEKGR